MIGTAKPGWWHGLTYTISGENGKYRELKLHVPNSSDPDAKQIVINYDMTRPVGKLIDVMAGLFTELTKPKYDSPRAFQLQYRRRWWKFWQPKYITIVAGNINGTNPTYAIYDPKNPAHEMIGKAGFTALYHKGRPITRDKAAE